MALEKVLTAGIGELNLRDIDVYRAQGGYVQLERAIKELAPADILDLANKSGLRGRGGAGFPTGRSGRSCPPTTGRVISCAIRTRPSRGRSKITC